MEGLMGFAILCLILWICCGSIAYIIGREKGEGTMSFVAGFLLGPIGIVGALLSGGNRVACPACRSKIDPAATVCPYCRSSIVMSQNKGRSRFEKVFWIVFGVIVISLAIYGIIYQMSY